MRTVVGRYLLYTRNAILIIGLSIALYVLSTYNFLLFHSFVEFSTIIIMFSIFVIIWHSREYKNEPYFEFLGTGYLFVITIGFFHTLAYKGMNVFTGASNLPTQLWIAARYLEAFTLVLAPIFLFKSIDRIKIYFCYSVVTILVLCSIFFWNIFPDCFIEGSGLTTFKIVSEYVISLLFLASFIILSYNKTYFSESVFNKLSLFIFVTICAELSFTLYLDLYGVMNVTGHILRFISFIFLYLALAELGLTKPFYSMYLQLKSHELQVAILRQELQNNLFIASAHLEIFEDTKNPDYLKNVKQSLKESVLIIDSVKKIAGSGETMLKTYYIRPEIEKIVKSELKDINVDIQGNCSVQADEGILYVLSEIIRNISEHSHSEIADISLEEKDELCVIKINDYGIGIPKSIKNDIYRKKLIINKGKKRGLGGYISGSIINRYNGKIMIEDNKPSGTAVIIQLKKYRKYNLEKLTSKSGNK